MIEAAHRLIVSDARQLSSVTDESIALIITSPPYPMIAMWDEIFSEQSTAVRAAFASDNHIDAFEAMHVLLDRAWGEAERVLCPGGHLCINIGDAVRSDSRQFRLHPNHSRITSSLAELGFTILPSIIWRKPANSPTKFMGSGMLPGGAYVTLEHEHILVVRKGRLRKPATEEERFCRRESALFWEERNEWYSDLWTLPGVRQSLAAAGAGEATTQVRARSAAYPFDLPYRIISMYSWIGDTVLDPFGGTGTTALAAAALARHSLTIDTDSALIEIARAAIGAPSTKRDLQQRTTARLDRHRLFVEKREKPMKHQNEQYGFPVVTSQETDLNLPYLTSVQPDGDTYRCLYSNVPVTTADQYELWQRPRTTHLPRG